MPKAGRESIGGSNMKKCHFRTVGDRTTTVNIPNSGVGDVSHCFSRRDPYVPFKYLAVIGEGDLKEG